MNEVNSVNWFEEQLLKSLEEPSIIVMNNASYHSAVINKAPTAACEVSSLELGLMKQYAVDTIAEKSGHSVAGGGMAKAVAMWKEAPIMEWWEREESCH
ncbi:hypothetical protein ILUMI_12970 [Ignelater luminosus]|uniref:Uncharacterized protein n=1 Tax=Ignelater luminosus TaxID=2038154 RepID=A0A8K0GCF6_IGNLU|nr:hypothetical protein ILUMI_12970 [Ignelater luminosus]